jgi:hypothetical protein
VPYGPNTQTSSAKPGSEDCGSERDRALFLRDLVRFIGPNAASYLPHARRFLAGTVDAKNAFLHNPLFSWHWPAFLATVPWLFYRKMYAGGIVLVSAPVVLNLIVPGGLFLGWALLIALVAGLFGRRWYLDHARRRISDAHRTFPDGQHKVAFLRQTGGVSVPGAILGSTIECATVTATLSGILNGIGG